MAETSTTPDRSEIGSVMFDEGYDLFNRYYLTDSSMMLTYGLAVGTALITASFF